MDARESDDRIEKEIEELRQRVGELETARDGRWPDSPRERHGDYFRLLVENAYDAILVLDRDGTILHASPSIKRIAGFDPEELQGKALFEFVHPDDLPVAEKLARGVSIPGHMEHVECRSLRKDGSWFVAEAVAKNLLHNPVVAGIVINLRDVTAYRRMEEELRESEERYRSLVENLNEVVFEVDNQGTVVYISPAIERVSQYRAAEVVGQPFMKFIHPDDLPGLLESFQRTLNGVLEPYEFRVIDRDGSLHYMRTSSRPYEENGRVAGLIGLMTEITGRKEADEARKRSEENFRAMIRQNIRYFRRT